jgi:hypothetical protein
MAIAVDHQKVKRRRHLAAPFSATAIILSRFRAFSFPNTAPRSGNPAGCQVNCGAYGKMSQPPKNGKMGHIHGRKTVDVMLGYASN